MSLGQYRIQCKAGELRTLLLSVKESAVKPQRGTKVTLNKEITLTNLFPTSEI